jgi:SAM-dependent methyltransferase
MSDITHSRRIDSCLITNNPVTKILDFGQHAYADTFIAKDQLHLSEPVFPLEVYMNSESGMIQLGYFSDAEDRYNLYAYSYTSSNSKTSRDHWDEYAQTVKSKFNTQGLVVEIGSNDGYLIGQFNQPLTTALGIDSSKDMCEISRKNGVKTLQGLFSYHMSEDIKSSKGTAKVIMANNVFNHANNPIEFAQGVANLLSLDGVFVFEVPYWAWMVTNDKFPDMVYHEHPTYFTIKGIQTLLSKVGLSIADYELVNYHGQSLRIVAHHSNTVTDKVSKAIQKETEQGLFDTDFYKSLQHKLEIDKVKWLAKFYKLIEDDPKAVVIGVGAAAKANTWLNFYGLNKTVIKCITDASEFKQGKYTPLSRIPIMSDNEFAEYNNPYALILSWNIAEPLKQALLKINPNTRFLSQ